jgi:P4 family phage/plasmid primase-like protien
VLGIDVDAYDDRAGSKTLAAAERAWGALPATWVATSRPGTGSGIRLYRVPEGLSWPESLRKFHGGGVDLIRWDHRYAVVCPSMHPNGAQYVWGRPDGQWVADEVPEPSDLPELPSSWVEGLTAGKTWAARATEELSQDDIRAWLADRGSGEACAVMSRTLAQYQRQVREAGDDGGAHDVARNGAWALIGDAAAGHGGVLSGLGKLRNTFLEAVKGRRGERQARGEWARMLIRGVQKVSAEGDVAEDDPCELLTSEWSPVRTPRTGSGAFDYARDDIGNAQRLVNWVGDDIRYIEGLGGWHIWERGRWVLDRSGQIQRWAFEMVRSMEREAEFIEETKARAAFIAWIRSSGNASRLKAMVDLARSMRGMTWEAKELDAKPSLVLCPNGLLELESDGVVFRPVEREDRITLVTRASYVEGATSELWDKFITRSVPDAPTRQWLQKALGYCMYGRNPLRLLFLIQGKTSSGKTTLAEAVRSCLGDYAAPFNLSLFRATKDQGANVQLVRLLGRRFIVASEASSDWFLHADEIKRITGGDSISARLNFSNDLIEAVPSFTPWIVTNDAPTINGADLALYRRLYTIRMDETLDPAEEDATLLDRLQEEGCASAVLSWLVEGWRMYCADKLLGVPAAVVEATLATREELSEFDVFLGDCCVQESEAAALAKDLYAAYEAWCSRNGSKPESSVLFGRSLSKRGMERRVARIGEKTFRVRSGIRLNSWAMNEVQGTEIEG